MTVILNGRPVVCSEGETLKTLLDKEKIDTSNIAIAVDDVVISRAQWSELTLKQNSKILLVKATQGG